jgi:adenosylmethionine-8-amino-7-oxononanoate aminotransferase
MGRTGTLFACEQDQISPDIMVIAKGLGAGYQPIGAVLVSKRIFKAFKTGSGIFLHGHTYMGHATACAAALAVQKKIKTLDLVRKVKMSGAKLFGDLKDAFGEHPYIGDIRGRGLFIGIELVSDRLTKKPFSSSLKINSQVRRMAMEYGLICYPGGGTVDGLNGDHILIAPPYIIEEKDFVEIINKLKKSVNEVLLRNDFPI